MPLIGQAIALVLEIFIGLMFVRLVVDLIQMFARSWSPRGVALVLLETVYTITDPPIRAFRRVVPPIRIGGVALDLSFLLVLVVCWLLLRINYLVWTSY